MTGGHERGIGKRDFEIASDWDERDFIVSTEYWRLEFLESCALQQIKMPQWHADYFRSIRTPGIGDSEIVFLLREEYQQQNA